MYELDTSSGCKSLDAKAHAQDEGDEFHASSRLAAFEKLAMSEYTCSIWGPTCDSMDCITSSTMLPELSVGDWIYFSGMGAYTNAAASEFNGFAKSRIFYTQTGMENEC